MQDRETAGFCSTRYVLGLADGKNNMGKTEAAQNEDKQNVN
jgi:hypothetical protein